MCTHCLSVHPSTSTSSLHIHLLSTCVSLFYLSTHYLYIIFICESTHPFIHPPLYLSIHLSSTEPPTGNHVTRRLCLSLCTWWNTVCLKCLRLQLPFSALELLSMAFSYLTRHGRREHHRERAERTRAPRRLPPGRMCFFRWRNTPVSRCREKQGGPFKGLCSHFA